MSREDTVHCVVGKHPRQIYDLVADPDLSITSIVTTLTTELTDDQITELNLALTSTQGTVLQRLFSPDSPLRATARRHTGQSLRRGKRGTRQ